MPVSRLPTRLADFLLTLLLFELQAQPCCPQEDQKLLTAFISTSHTISLLCFEFEHHAATVLIGVRPYLRSVQISRASVFSCKESFDPV
jgi:hypothetical protein